MTCNSYGDDFVIDKKKPGELSSDLVGKGKWSEIMIGN